MASAKTATKSPQEEQDDLFRALKVQISTEDSKSIIETCKKLLVHLPKDSDVLRCYATALLQTGQFQACVDAFAAIPAQPPIAVLERAYAYYRLNQLPAAQALLASVAGGQKSKALLHLEAQVFYRSGQFHKSVEIYEKNFFPIDKKDHELRTNVMAAYIGAGAPDKALAIAGGGAAEAALTYELAYNTACALIDMHDPAAAGKSLETARKLCRESLSDLSEAELKDELAAIEVQTGYVLQLQQQTDAAHKIYQDIINSKPSDSSVFATAENNIITLRKMNEKLFDSIKRSAKAVTNDHKLSPRQKSAIHLNRCLVLMAGKAGNEGTAIAESLRKEFPDSEFPVLVLASLYYNEKNYAKCDETLNSYIKAYPSNCLQSLLTLAHIPLSLGKYADSIKSLSSIAAIQHRPAVVATLMALYERSGDLKGAGKVIDAAIDHWSKQTGTGTLLVAGAVGTSTHPVTIKHTLNILLEKAAEFRLKHKMYAEAVTTFEQLVKAGATSGSGGSGSGSGGGKENEMDTARSISTLVLAASKMAGAESSAAAARALGYSTRLPPLPGLDALKASIDKLESVSAPRSDAARRTQKSSKSKSKAAAAAAVAAAAAKKPGDAKDSKSDAKAPASAAAAGAAAAADKKRKKRKARYPKGFDTSKPLPGTADPERWLPRWQRKSGKKQRRNRSRREGEGREFRGAQGAGTLTGADATATVSAAAADAKDSSAVGTPALAKPGINLRAAAKAAKRSKKGKKGGW